MGCGLVCVLHRAGNTAGTGGIFEAEAGWERSRRLLWWWSDEFLTLGVPVGRWREIGDFGSGCEFLNGVAETMGLLQRGMKSAKNEPRQKFSFSERVVLVTVAGMSWVGHVYAVW